LKYILTAHLIQNNAWSAEEHGLLIVMITGKALAVLLAAATLITSTALMTTAAGIHRMHGLLQMVAMMSLTVLKMVKL